MIEGLQPYPDYRDSTAPWFGNVPAHWKVKRLGAVFGERGETNERREVTEILSVLKDRGVILYSEKGRIGNKASDDIGRYKIVRPDDLVVNCMNVIIGSLGRSRYTGCLSPVYYVLRRRDLNHDPRYLELVFQHKPFHESLIRIGNGILAHRMRIPMEKLKAEMFPLPPLDEQKAVVRFLEHANRKIDGFIRAKRKLIGLLNEQKQAIIHRAVTRGLDPNAPLKPSGIPWLGDIPEHWELRPVRALFTEIKDRGHEGEPMLSVTIKRGVITQAELLENSIKRDSSNEDKSKYKLLLPGDIGYNKMRAWQGAFGVSGHRGIISPAYIVVRPTALADSRFYHFLFRTPAFAKVAESWSYGIASDMWSLRPEHFRLIVVAVPPKSEQAQIAGRLNEDLSQFDTAITRTEREIALMQEYRTRLTADVVTGKLDVRAAAAKLPDLTEEEPMALDADAENAEVEEEV